MRGHIDSGKLRALAVSKATRNPMWPGVPTMVESGFPDFVVAAWFGVFAPAGVSEAVADKLNEMVLAAMRSPDYASRVTGLGLEIEPISRRSFARTLAAESDRWKQLIDAANISVDE